MSFTPLNVRQREDSNIQSHLTPENRNWENLQSRECNTVRSFAGFNKHSLIQWLNFAAVQNHHTIKYLTPCCRNLKYIFYDILSFGCKKMQSHFKLFEMKI